MIFFKESGIAISDDLQQDLLDGISKFKSLRAFATAWNIPQSSLNYLLGKGGRERKQITWDAWPPIRHYLEAIGRIKKNDVEWLIPSELREQIKKQDIVLTDEERELLYRFRTLNEAGKNAVIASAKAMSETALLSNSESATHKLA